MSVDLLPTEKAKPPARGDKVVGYDEYIDTQIRQTRRMVKAVDIATGLVVLATGVLVFLLVVAAAEHWLVPGGFGTLERSLLFAVLAISVGQHLYRRVWPLLVRPINPVFAAQTIERSSPSLKNSLLNLLLFRERRSDVTDAVYETLEEQAAHGLTRVPVESAVDRTHLIRLGYTLVAVFAVCALYKVFSPKDPVVVVERVLMPWADIVPASRVAINNVEPGSTTIARGEMLPISAEVSGVGEDDSVVVRYTTADGQAVEKAVAMKPSTTGLRYTAQLPAASEPGRPTGVAQNLRYRIEAGDARSHVYSVTVVAAPTITVERVDYDYPTYTGIADRSVEGLGDIRAIEGTRVTIHARANEPIEEASIDFEADGRRDVRMTVKDDLAEASFVLALRDDHQTPKYTSYVLRFKGTEGRSNRDPVKYPIDVLSDYAPEVSILAPKEKVRDVRFDETVAIEVEARDPDFALSEVRLKGDAAGREVLDESLLSKEQSGRFTGRLQFTPAEHGLKVGDVLHYWVAARDNRSPKPNEVASEQQTLRIVSPGPNPQQPPDRLAQRDRRPPQPGDQQRDQSPPGGAQNDQQQPGDGKQSPHEKQGDQPPQSGAESGDQDSGQKSKEKSQGDKSQGGESKDGQSDSNQQQDGESQGGESKDGKSSGGQNEKGQSSGDDQQSKDNNSQQQQSGGSEKGGGHDKSQKQPGQPSAGGNSSSEKNSESGPAGEGQGSTGNQGGSNGQPNGRAGNKGGDSRSAKDQRDSTGGSGAKGGHEQIKPGDSPSQVSPEGDNDGEAFDRIQKFLKQKGELRDPSGSDKQPKDDQQTSGDGQSSKSGSGQQAQSSGGRTPPSEGTSGAEKSPDGKKVAQQGEQPKKPEGGKQPGDGKSSGEKQSPDGATHEKENQPKQGGEALGKNGDRAENGRQGERKTDPGQQAEDATKGAPSSEQPGENARGVDKDSGSVKQPGSEKDSSQQTGDQQNNSQMPKGQPGQSKGDNGGGQSTQHDTGSPDAGMPIKPRDKWQQNGSDEKKSGDGQDPASGGRSKHESDSKGDQGGDKAGGGTQGGGQQSPHDGTGSSGQNQSADEGAGESSEHGKGHDSPSAGKDAKSDHRTGQSGSNDAGNGSGQRDGQGEEPGGKPGDAGKSSNSKSGDNKSADDKSPGENSSAVGDRGDKSSGGKQQGDQGSKDGKSPSDKPSKDGKQPQGQPDDKSGRKSADKTGKGGEQSQPNAKQSPRSQPEQSGGGSSSSNNGTPGAPLGAGGPTKTDAKAPEADAANLEYARKQTDLVVETLAEQMKRNKVDKRLLDELGWSEPDLKRFVERWQQLKEAARGNSPAADAAQKELDDALRSLGLQHGTLQQAKVKEDSVRDLREGYHGPVPLEYQERLRAYNQGVSRARQDGE